MKKYIMNLFELTALIIISLSFIGFLWKFLYEISF